MSLVLDASIALAWALPDEDSALAQHVFEIIEGDGGWVPDIWRLEVANGLQIGVRRGRIDIGLRGGILADLADFPVRVDGETDRHAWGGTLTLASRLDLTLYDACYLELALRRHLPLATLDRNLRDAAAKAGVGVIDA
ncbi:type II toxin-antitoxin system VapC family toxin [Pseudorhodoplanes sp.]|uniref:type II toxin-antitoxin system VapC family toxin n=1 Tax=Pseudorhodoplanes sp. TaxID=1934341 RepID=UPI003D0DCB68